MHKHIMQKAAKALKKDAEHYAKDEKHAHGKKKTHDKVERKEAMAGAKSMKKMAKRAHEY